MSNYKDKYPDETTFRMRDNELFIEFKMSAGMSIEEFTQWLLDWKEDNENVILKITIPTTELIDFIRDSAIEKVLDDSEKYPDALKALKTVMKK